MSNENTPRVAIYCRVANESQHDHCEIERQRKLLEHHALTLGYSRLAYYEDNGWGGLTLDRPGFQQMEADIQAGKIGAVLVKDISRVGRNMHQTAAWINSTTGKGIEFISVQDDYKPFAFPDWETLYKAHRAGQRKTKADKRK